MTTIMKVVYSQVVVFDYCHLARCVPAPLLEPVVTVHSPLLEQGVTVHSPLLEQGVTIQPHDHQLQLEPAATQDSVGM